MPKHYLKIDIDPYKEAVTVRKEAPTRQLGVGQVVGQEGGARKGFHFHHELSTDDVSLL